MRACKNTNDYNLQEVIEISNRTIIAIFYGVSSIAKKKKSIISRVVVFCVSI